jgi:fructan beta-fructosidase
MLALISLLHTGCLNTKLESLPLKKPEGKEKYYDEPYRPQFHFSPKAHWMNDPNGMVYLGGEYHLFYQYYPDSTVWGPMHWGHAVSTDLVHWDHLPIALYPDSLGYIFSGSVVVDHHNTSGLGAQGQDPMIAIFTPTFSTKRKSRV